VAAVTFALPEGLPPEVYPLAWLVGAWRGEGTIGYGPIDQGRITQEVSFTAGEGPYLAYTARTWLAAPAPPAPNAPDPADPADPSGQLWHEESGYWRVTPGQNRQDPPFEVEALVADPAGFLSLYLGEVDGPRVQLGTDAMVRTASAAEVTAATRMYGLVEGDLLWAWDIAGFGEPLGSYMAAHLKRATP
jgi:hypothetical protein